MINTIKILSVSLLIYGITLISTYFWEDLGLGNDEAFIIATAMTIAFGFNIAGLVVGFFERRKDRIQLIIGLIGNLILICLYLAIIFYVVTTT